MNQSAPAPSHAESVRLLWTSKDLTARFGWRPGTIACWVARKQIPFLRVNARCTMFEPEVIMAWLAAKRVTPAE